MQLWWCVQAWVFWSINFYEANLTVKPSCKEQNLINILKGDQQRHFKKGEPEASATFDSPYIHHLQQSVCLTVS